MTVVTLRMTTEERACTLRAIHGRRTEIRGEIERAESVGPDNDDAKVKILALRLELACLQSATRALWDERI